jgi:hypothetical protein
MNDLISIQHLGTQSLEISKDGGFSGANATRDCYQRHS